MKKIVAIDPGKNGAYSIFEGDQFVNVYYLDDFEDYRRIIDYKPDAIIIEYVHAFPNQGTVSMFTFGYYTGIAMMTATLATENVYKVDPTKWRRYFRLLTGKYAERKSNAYLEAKKYTSKVNLRTADAFLIGLYGIKALELYKE